MAKEIHRGGCLCRAVRFAARGEVIWIAYCHCASCRRHTGAPVSAYAGFRADQVSFDAGSPAIHVSSEGVLRGFCGTCGSTLTYEGRRWPGELHIHLGAMDEPEDFVPSAEAFAEEKLPWLRLAV